MAFQGVLEGCKNAFISCIDYLKLVILERDAAIQEEISDDTSNTEQRHDSEDHETLESLQAQNSQLQEQLNFERHRHRQVEAEWHGRQYEYEMWLPRVKAILPQLVGNGVAAKGILLTHHVPYPYDVQLHVDEQALQIWKDAPKSSRSSSNISSFRRPESVPMARQPAQRRYSQSRPSSAAQQTSRERREDFELYPDPWTNGLDERDPPGTRDRFTTREAPGYLEDISEHPTPPPAPSPPGYQDDIISEHPTPPPAPSPPGYQDDIISEHPAPSPPRHHHHHHNNIGERFTPSPPHHHHTNIEDWLRPPATRPQWPPDAQSEEFRASAPGNLWLRPPSQWPPDAQSETEEQFRARTGDLVIDI